MERRELLRSLGAAAALSVVPRHAGAVWTRVASWQPATAGLTEAQLALVSALADTIIPRTDSPGALDVAVPAWVDVIVSEYYADEERISFLSGLDAIDALARTTAGAPFARLTAAAREAVMAALEDRGDRQAPEARTYWRLKGLVLHGYFTSERVQKDVLHYVIMPGRFDGNAPMPAHGGGDA